MGVYAWVVCVCGWDQKCGEQNASVLIECTEDYGGPKVDIK